MTARAAAVVAVDWQIEVQPTGTTATVLDTVRATPRVQAVAPVGFASSGLSSTGATSIRTTGPAMVLGIPPNYRDTWPGDLRTLAEAHRGVLIAQQTSANLTHPELSTRCPKK
jgi:putative ABC transport system permease protein